MSEKNPWDKKFILATLWIAFTMALAVWLFVYHTRLFGEIENLNSPEAQSIGKHGRMVASELASMIIALLLGGAWLLYLVWLERRQSSQIRSFFAVFTHELKTSLSRLRLRSESLKNDLKLSGRSNQILDDIAKLEVQLENSLWIAHGNEEHLLIEDLQLSQILSEFSAQFPLTVHLSREAYPRVDRRVLESLIKNMLQNSVLHGKAQNFWIDVLELPNQKLILVFRDDGAGFKGDYTQLGLDLRRHGTSSGSGLGLFIIRKLSLLINAKVNFAAAKSPGGTPGEAQSGGFQVEIELAGQLQAPGTVKNTNSQSLRSGGL